MDFDGCFLHFHFTPLETIRFENDGGRSEEHTSELQSQSNLVCRLLLEKKKNTCPLRLLKVITHIRPLLARNLSCPSPSARGDTPPHPPAPEFSLACPRHPAHLPPHRES